MEFSDDARAILLLTAALKGQSQDKLNPLTSAEWRKLRSLLDKNAGRPQDLLKDTAVLRDWTFQNRQPTRYGGKKLLIDDIEKLLGRDKDIHKNIIEPWEKASEDYGEIEFWIVTYTDDEYPEQLKKRLPDRYPPLFFGIGDRSLLKCGGLAVVGSRHASKPGLEYAYDIGQAAANERITIISGGARGVDLEAMRGALERGGNVVGILSDKLLKRLDDESYRDYLENNKLVYVSVVGPQGHTDRYGFLRAAMERNAYIYCLSDAALVVHSSNKGGTWSGATENLKKGWVPLWVRYSDNIRRKYSHGVKKRGKTTGGLRILSQPMSIRTAVLLLTVSLRGDDLSRVCPMNFWEWGHFARWLWDNGLTPANLVEGSLDEILRGWDRSQVSVSRIRTLLDKDRQDRLAQHEESWRSAEIRVLTKTDREYPRVLKDKLGDYCPAVLFVRGDHELLDQDKIAVVGSPPVNEEDKKKGSTKENEGEENEKKEYAGWLATSIAKRTASVLVSIDGIDTVVVDTVLSNKGKCIVVLAGNLLKNSIEAPGELIKKKKLTFLSASSPNAAPTPQDFEQHSDIAHCLSDAGVVMYSDGQADILQRAMKCLQNRWTPLWVKGFGGETAGAEALVKEGGTDLSKWDGESNVIHQVQNIVWRSTVIKKIVEEGGMCLPQSEDTSGHVQRILDAGEPAQEQVDQGPLFNQ